jgi:pilus assembly protein CpaF
MSWELVLGFFPEEMQTLILDPTISDLMINGTTGVFADRDGVVKRSNFLTYIAMLHLQGLTPPPIRLLPEEVQADIKMLWPSYKSGCLLNTDRGVFWRRTT